MSVQAELDPERVAAAKAKARLAVKNAMHHQNQARKEHERAKSIARTWGFTLRSLTDDDLPKGSS